MIEGDPLVIGARAAQLRCLEHIPEFTPNAAQFREALELLEVVMTSTNMVQAEVSKHSIAFFAEVAAVSIFARRHYSDSQLGPEQYAELWGSLRRMWNSFTHYGKG